MFGKLFHKDLRILQRHFRRYVVLFANLLRNDFLETCRPVRGFPDDCCDLIQGEQGGAAGGHDHRFIAQPPRGDRGASSHIPFLNHTISSHMPISGTNVSRRTGTWLTKSNAASKTSFTNSASRAKKRIFRSRPRPASAPTIGLILFSKPFASRYKHSIGARRFSPTRASSPKNGVPTAKYRPSGRVT